MKRVFQHPPARETGRTYWRGVEEYSNSPQFKEWLEREFPAGAAEFSGDEVSRRSFLRLMGASMALAGLGMSGCRRPEAHFAAYTKTPEWLVPGKSLTYATSLPRRRGGAPLLVTTYQGRPVKIEGNPGHPASKGKSDLRAQAAVLDLYDPDRSRTALKAGAAIPAAQFVEAAEAALKESGTGAGVAFLTEDPASPTLLRLRGELLKKFPAAGWFVHEPLASSGEQAALRAAFGEGRALRLRTEKARVLLTLDADLFGTDEGTLGAVRGFADGRKLRDSATPMNRLYAVESRYTLTGSCADHRLRAAASHIPAVAQALLQAVNGQAFDLPAGIDPAWIREAAADLKAAGREALVAAGANQPAATHLAVLALNQALGALGSTVEVITAPAVAAGDLAALAGRITAGEIQTLFILGANPGYTAPADLGWAALQSKVANVFHLGTHVDETAAAAQWHLPMAHFLEAWGDAVLEDGSLGCIQPMILPLWGGVSVLQLIARLAGVASPAGKLFVEGPELIQETLRARLGGGYSESAWQLFVRDGFLKDSAPASAGAPGGGLASALAAASFAAPALSASNLEVVFAPSPAMEDGRLANNGWLQELPDPLTKVTWDNAALLSPKTAQALGLYQKTEKGIETSDVITLTVDGRSVEAPILIQPGHADFSITLVLGYGRTQAGHVGTNVGYNAYAVRSSAAPFIATGAQVAKTGRRHQFAITQEHWSMEGRDIVREASLEHYKSHPRFAFEQGLESHAKPTERTLYKTPPFDYQKFHQWGMVIDLTSCTGCSACVVACQSENNIPIVGKDQVMKGREMHWMRIDRYFSAASKFRSDNAKEELPNDPEMVMQPVTCMHCENAPCETVCPVNATVHNEEGLNVMAYNRCIGTRYCANNCPYKVRRFNYFDYNKRKLDELYMGPLGGAGKAESLSMQKNPNVTVRMRGVIEKCTFCVQRLETSKIHHKAQARKQGRYTDGDLKLPTDSVQVACQQACPADAIVFGDLSDPESRVSRLKLLDRNYNLLDYLNVRPRLSYLARVRNPNPKMPGAELVGMDLVHGKAHKSDHGVASGTHTDSGTEKEPLGREGAEKKGH